MALGGYGNSFGVKNAIFCHQPSVRLAKNRAEAGLTGCGGGGLSCLGESLFVWRWPFPMLYIKSQLKLLVGTSGRQNSGGTKNLEKFA